MTRNVNRDFLQKAKSNKNDEFYTQLKDIERELFHYESHFKDKVVYCNCDDVRVSNFFRYFINNFDKLGIKKLICACYKDDKSEKGFWYEYNGIENFDSDTPLST